jgi:hypothetical protein
MRRDVHFAALQAASRVAFSVAFLGGCSAAGEVDDADEGESYESAIHAGSPSKSKPKSRSVGKKPCPSKDAGKPSCESVLASTFGDAGGWGEQVTLSADAKACCSEVVKQSMAQDPTAERSPYHWACCSASNWGQDLDVGDGGVGWACTPWGPPVPPAMTKKRIIRAEPEVWIGVA